MRKEFIKKRNETVVGLDVKTLLRRKAIGGEVGIEIEVEGKKLPKDEIYDETRCLWKYHHDGSLRGADNAEYVLFKPVMFSEVPGALARLWSVFKDYKAVFDDSNRTSIHVHLNCQNFHMNRLTSFLALYFTLEEVLTEWCGDHRVGNLFCLRAKDAPSIITQAKKMIQQNGSGGVSEHLHYSGLNLHALFKFGSLEVRTLRGVDNPETIIDWINVLERIYRLSADYPDPRDICGMFSREGPISFFDTVLGSSASVIRRGISMTEDEIRESMYDGIRMAQDLCYCRDWSLFKAVNMKEDPFGRDQSKLAKSLMGMGLFAENTYTANNYSLPNGSVIYVGTQPSPQPNPFAVPEPIEWPAPEAAYEEDSNYEPELTYDELMGETF